MESQRGMSLVELLVAIALLGSIAVLSAQLVIQSTNRRKDGSHYEVEVHLQMAKHNLRPAFVAIILQITERNRAE